MSNTIDLFQILPTLTPSANDVLQAELLCTQILQSSDATLDLRPGTALYDLVIRPTATLTATLRAGLNYYNSQDSIPNISNTTDTTIVDQLLGNWFSVRNTGTYASINARLYFAIQKSVTIPTGAAFSPDGVNVFSVPQTLTFSPSALTFDAASNEYYVDVSMTARTAGTSSNLSGGGLIYFTNFDAYFLRGIINYLETAAIDTETNLQFLQRTQSGISTRNLINRPSIAYNLSTLFPALTINNIASFGMADPQMVRDLVQVLPPGSSKPIWIHIGGMVDIYCNTPLEIQSLQLTLDANGSATLTGPYLKVTRSTVSAGSSPDTAPVYLTVPVLAIDWANNIASVSTGQAHGYTTGDSVTIQGAPYGFNGTFNVTVTGAQAFTYPLNNPGVSATTATGMTAGVPVPFTVTPTNRYILPISSIISSGTVATVTSDNHPVQPNRYLTFNGTMNGVYRVEAVIDENTFTIVSTDGSTIVVPGGGYGAFYVDPAQDYGFSQQQTLTLSAGPTYANQTFSVNMLYWSQLDSYQNYVSSTTAKILCANQLIRGFNVYILSLNVVSYTGVAPNSVTVQTAAQNYINSLLPGQAFIMADLVTYLSAAGINEVQTPIGVNYVLYNTDMTEPITGSTTDIIAPPDTTYVFAIGSVTTSGAPI